MPRRPEPGGVHPAAADRLPGEQGQDDRQQVRPEPEDLERAAAESVAPKVPIAFSGRARPPPRKKNDGSSG